MKKLWRVKETYRWIGWTYVMADTEEEAVKKIENGEGDFEFNFAEERHEDTNWDTLEEKI